MPTLLVTVIIPTYNRAQYLIQAVESVLHQTCQTFEIIVVDDGSTDNTKEVLSSYISSGKLIYAYQENSGPSAARNVGIRLAQGEYIGFLDSDDLWDPDKLELQLAEFHNDSDLGIIFTNARYIDEKSAICKDSMSDPDYLFNGDFICQIAEYRFPHASDTVLVRKSVLDIIGNFDETLRLAEDIDLWIRIAFRHKVGFIHRPLISVRIHSSSLMRQSSYSLLRLKAVEVFIKHNKDMRKHLSTFDKCIADSYDSIGNDLLLNGERLHAFVNYFKALLYTPLENKRYKDLLRCLFPMSYLLRKYEFATTTK